MAKLKQLSVYFPDKKGRALKTKAVERYGSVSKYLKVLVEQDEDPNNDPHAKKLDQITQQLHQLLQVTQYNLIGQNATAHHLSPQLLEDIQTVYRDKFGSTPDAR